MLLSPTETDFRTPIPTHYLHKKAKSLIIQSTSTSNQIEINFTSLSIQKTSIDVQLQLTRIAAYGVLGIFTFELRSYLIYITNAIYCSTVNNNPIYKIDSINVISLSSEEQPQLDSTVLSNIQQLLINDFYYSPLGYDLTLTYTSQYQHSNSNYWYNKEWSKLFYMSNIGLKNEFTLSIIHGYVGECCYTIDDMEIRVVIVIRRTVKEIDCYFCESELFIYGLPYNEVFNYVIYFCTDKDDIYAIVDVVNETFIKCSNISLNKICFIENNGDNETNGTFISKLNEASKVNCTYIISVDQKEFLSNIQTNNILNLIHYTQVQRLYNTTNDTFTPPEYQLGHIIVITNTTKKILLHRAGEVINYVVSDYLSKLNNVNVVSSFKQNFSSLVNDIIQSNTFHSTSYFPLMSLFHNNSDAISVNELSVSNSIIATSSNDLSIYAVTWNVQGLQIDNSTEIDASQLVYPPQFQMIINKERSPDIIIVGLQEIIEIKAKNFLSQIGKKKRERKDNWQIYFESILFEDYDLLVSLNLVGISLFCFIKKNREKNVKNVHSQTIKTGFKGVLGNKGYCIISFEYNKRKFAFVNGHFMSGESNEKNEGRIKEITQLLTNEHSKDILPVNQHDYYFLIGDFNFRVELSPEECNELISRRDISKIIEKDQFIQSKKKFPFQEGDICFLPTYKLGSNIHEYKLTRTPSYCDRIFYKGQQDKTIKQIVYSSVNYFFNSDHLPVCSLFQIDLINS